MKKEKIFSEGVILEMRSTKKLALSGLFLALGLIMPFLTMQISEIGNMLLPMHIPVLICGFVCGSSWGAVVGFITPLLRSAIFGMPYMMPTAVGMAFELTTYGFITGIMYVLFKKSKLGTYVSLIIAMIVGRIVWGLVSIAIYRLMEGVAFTWEMFVGGALFQAVPGIVLQLVVIPPVIFLLKKARVIEE